jgi:hypothetical protein
VLSRRWGVATSLRCESGPATAGEAQLGPLTVVSQDSTGKGPDADLMWARDGNQGDDPEDRPVAFCNVA